MVNLQMEFSDKAVTPFGGISLNQRFIDNVGSREQLKVMNLPQPGSYKGCSTDVIKESLFLSI